MNLRDRGVHKTVVESCPSQKQIRGQYFGRHQEQSLEIINQLHQIGGSKTSDRELIS